MWNAGTVLLIFTKEHLQYQPGNLFFPFYDTVSELYLYRASSCDIVPFPLLPYYLYSTCTHFTVDISAAAFYYQQPLRCTGLSA